MGFAVVADEVRSLAQRSAQAAKDTAALIEESIAKSNEGSTKLQRVADVIRAITDDAAKVKTLVDEVNLGSQEQARGIDEISKAIMQMSRVTQTTAASAEESASSSEELSAQAEALRGAVKELRALVMTDEEESGVRPDHAHRARPVDSGSLKALRTAVAHPKPEGAKVAAPKVAAKAAIPLEEEQFTEI
jgi:methyl-accepting chemotaxis protein/methyl-accepting chemotaxis protein-1 (serine sensor receptor)